MESKELFALLVAAFSEPIKQLVRDAVREEISNLQPAGNVNAKEELTVEEAADLLKVKKQTLYGYVSRKLIPHYKPAKHLIFKRSELLEFMLNNKCMTRKEIEKAAEDNFLNANKKRRA